VLLQVAQGLPGVPREHITVYTLIREGCKWERRGRDALRWTQPSIVRICPG
jgi:hypothetical protein